MEEFDKLDEVFREGLKNAKLSPPPGVWEGIAASTSAATTGSVGIASLLTIKWFAAIVTIGAVSVATYYFATKPNIPIEKDIAKIVPSKPQTTVVEQSNQTPTEIAVENETKIIDQNTNANAAQSQIAVPNSNQGRTEEDTRFIINEFIRKTQPKIKINPSQDPKGNKGAVNEGNVEGTSPAKPCAHSLDLLVTKISNTAYSFLAKNPIGNVTWYFGDGISTYGFQTAHSFANIPAEYKVKAVTESMATGCKDSSFYNIVVPGVKPVLTNIFTPNGDGFNDLYYVEIQHAVEYELTVLDLQKRVVFSSKDPNLKWDGSCKNIQCPEGKYEVLFTYQYAGETKPTVLREILTLSRNN